MDSETRSAMKKHLNSLSVCDEQRRADLVELFTDWVYDQAYRKGWHHGYWRQDADISFQVSGMIRRRARKR